MFRSRISRGQVSRRLPSCEQQKSRLSRPMPPRASDISKRRTGKKSAKESADFCIPQESVFPIARDGAILFPTPQAKCLRRLALCCPGPEVLWKTGCSTRDISIMALSRDQVTSPPRRMSCMTPPSGMGNGYFAKTGAVLSTVGHHWSLQTFPSFILPSYGRFSGF